MLGWKEGALIHNCALLHFLLTFSPITDARTTASRQSLITLRVGMVVRDGACSVCIISRGDQWGTMNILPLI